MVPRLSRGVLALVIVALVAAGLILIVWQPWQRLRRVLAASVPGSQHEIELWERPYWHLGLGYEYETWFVMRSASGEGRWYLIDDRYIAFRDTVVLVSSDHNRVRVETDGEAGDFHMIAEYDIGRDEFRAASEPTVQHTRGWAVLSQARIH
jgi:hypothetical protein